MVNEKLMEMRSLVKEELEHVPPGDLKQNLLRQMYSSLRMNSLGKKPKYLNDRNEVLKISIEHEKSYWTKEGQEFTPKYDKKYFKI